MIEQTNKEKIIIVLKESVKFGRETGFIYNDMFEKHREVQLISNIGKTIKEKIELFNNMDESSHLFETIYDCAKLALSNMLEKKRYNYFCAELIMKIISLEEVFKKRLRPIGVHINSDVKQKIETTPSHEELFEEKTNLEEVIQFEPITRNARFIPQGVSGKDLVIAKQKRDELINTLKTTSFE